jgi:tetratricopeptide (TPR) repeat protein
VEDYLTLPAERTTELLAHAPPATYPVSLSASVHIALDRLIVQSPAALVLLSLAAYLAPEPIPLALFSSNPVQLPEPLSSVARDLVAFTALTRLLRQYGLARIESATLVLHRLLAAILRTQPHQHQDLPACAVRLLRAAVPADDSRRNPPVWPAWRQFLPHVLVATDTHRHLIGVEEDVAWLLERAAQYLQTRGDAASARPLFERARNLRRALLGADHSHTLESASSLSSNLWVLGQHEQARQLAEDTLTRCRRVLGENHPHTLTPAHSLAYALRELGHYEQSRQLGEATLTRCRRVLGEDHPDTLVGAFSLAPTLRAVGQYERACQLGEDTLTHPILGENYPHILRSTHNLAAALANLGKHDSDSVGD